MLTRNPEALAQDLDGEVLLLVPPHHEVLHLNSTASALWRLLAEPRSLDDVVGLLAEAYGAPVPLVRVDIEALLPMLRERRALVDP